MLLLTHKPGRIARCGTKRSVETKTKISKTLAGRRLSEAHKASISRARMGHKVDASTRNKISKNLTGFKHTDETKAKMRSASLGRKHTAEAVAKRIASLKKTVYAQRYKELTEGKVCIKCNTRKNLTEFHYVADRGIYLGSCKRCRSMYAKRWQHEWRFDNPERDRLIGRRCAAKVRRTLPEYFVRFTQKKMSHLPVEQLRDRIIAGRNKRLHKHSSDLALLKAAESIKNIHNKKNKGNI